METKNTKKRKQPEKTEKTEKKSEFKPVNGRKSPIFVKIKESDSKTQEQKQRIIIFQGCECVRI